MNKTPITPDALALGRSIRASRRQARLSQQTIADLLGMARTTLVAIEKGERKVRVCELSRLAEIFGVELPSLLAESETNRAREQLLALSGAQASVVARLVNMPPDPVLTKIILNLYDLPEVQAAVASTLIHLLVQHEQAENQQDQSLWLQETRKGA